jgi:hypothetical protein
MHELESTAPGLRVICSHLSCERFAVTCLLKVDPQSTKTAPSCEGFAITCLLIVDFQSTMTAYKFEYKKCMN